jgi:predicted nucleotidyltransferase
MNNVLDQLSNLTVSERLAVADLLNRLELEHSQTILQVMLYGSGARGERGAGSDVDLLIVTRHDDWRRQESIRLLAAHLSNAYDVFLSVRVLGVARFRQLQSTQPLLYASIAHGGLELLRIGDGLDLAKPQQLSPA